MEWQNVTDFLDEHGHMALELLEEIVNIDSPSREKEGTNKVGHVLCRYLEHFQIAYEIRRNETFGDHIIASIKGSIPGKILLMGHMDTVFGSGTAAERPFMTDDQYAYGPGVSDMKAGLVAMLITAAAIKQSACEHCDIELLFTPDEEIGSPSSRAVIEERARDAIAVFNIEPGRPNGAVVTGRKGSAHLQFEIAGRAAHSGVNIEEGISAITELGHKIVELNKLMDMQRGITVNVGLVQGGVNTNVVAPKASGTIHIGFWTVEDFAETIEKVRAIMNTSYVPGTSSVLHGDISFMPMETHGGVTGLYQIVQEAASILGIPITEQQAKGAADSGFTASMGVPTICGMGPIGGKWHNEGEYMVKESFLPRMKLLAISVMMASQLFANGRREE